MGRSLRICALLAIVVAAEAASVANAISVHERSNMRDSKQRRATASSRLRKVGGKKPLCGLASFVQGKCRCEDGRELQKTLTVTTNRNCDLGKDEDSGQPKEFTVIDWLRDKMHCPDFSDEILEKAMLCSSERNPCTPLDPKQAVKAFSECADEEVKEDQAEEEGGGVAEVIKQVGTPIMDRSMPELEEVLRWGKGNNLFETGSPWDKEYSTTDSIGDSLYGGTEKLGSALDSKDGAIHFSRNKQVSGKEILYGDPAKKGPFPYSVEEPRYLTSAPISVEGGAIVRTFVRYGDLQGGSKCKAKFAAMLAEVARMKRCEDEVELSASCANKAGDLCNGHGTPIFESGCSTNGKWLTGNDNTGSAVAANGDVDCSLETAQWNCHKKKWRNDKPSECTKCKCEAGYDPPDCTLKMVYCGQSRSVGDPHPSTTSGIYTNLYDGGEFVWYRHPDIPVEVHISSFPRGYVAVNAGFSIERCTSVDANKNMVPPCEGITDSGAKYTITAGGELKCNTLQYGCVKKSGSTMSTQKCAQMASSDSASISLSAGGGYYKNSYLRITSKNDGRAYGVAGHCGRSDWGGDGVANSGERGSHRQYTNEFYKKHRVSGTKSHFRCGGNDGTVRHHWASGFRETAARVGSGKALRAQAEATMQAQIKAQTEALTKLYAKEDLQNRRMRGMLGGDNKPEVAGNVVASEIATQWCTDWIVKCSKLQTPDEGALQGCVRDMVKIGNTEDGKKKTLENACALEKEDFVMAAEATREELKEVAQELAEAWPLLLPSKADLVLQYCVTGCDKNDDKAGTCRDYRSEPSLAVAKDKKHPVKVMNKACEKGTPGSGWQTMKTFSLDEYGSELTGQFKRFTSRFPEDAIKLAAAQQGENKNKLRIRYYQHRHPTCFCCDPVAIDEISVKRGGWPVRIIADHEFRLFADGEEVGFGEWAKRENSIDVNRFRISKQTKVIGIRVESKPKARNNRDKNLKTGMAGVLGSIGGSLVTSASWRCTTSDKIDDTKWLKQASTEAFNGQAALWPAAAELGINSEPATEPWGVIPGIAKTARWIFTHQTTKNAVTKAYCRVDSRAAWHSYDGEHPSASRWSCATEKDRQSAFVAPLSSSNSRFAAPSTRAGTQEAKSPATSSAGGWVSLKNSKDAGISTMLVRINLGDIMDQTTEGAMVKAATLRLFTEQGNVDAKICNLKPAGAGLDYGWTPDAAVYAAVAKNSADDCLNFKSIQKDFVRIDISDWVRAWRSKKESNIGFLVSVPENTELNIGAPDFEAANGDLRPRISLSCHGDQVDPSMVFKRTGVQVVATDGELADPHENIGASLPENFKNVGWFSDKNALRDEERLWFGNQETH